MQLQRGKGQPGHIIVQSDKRIFVRYYSSVAKMWFTDERVHRKYPHLH